ncbi:MAG: efflux RND transporter permease subunit [Synechococcaceae cyanobacterium]
MVDVANQLRREGADPVSAIHQACLSRFRPSTMSTAGAILGTLPPRPPRSAGSGGARDHGFVPPPPGR